MKLRNGMSSSPIVPAVSKSKTDPSFGQSAEKAVSSPAVNAVFQTVVQIVVLDCGKIRCSVESRHSQSQGHFRLYPDSRPVLEECAKVGSGHLRRRSFQSVRSLRILEPDDGNEPPAENADGSDGTALWWIRCPLCHRLHTAEIHIPAA